MLSVAIVVVPEAFPHSIIEPLDVFSRCQTIYSKRTGQTVDQKPLVALVGETRDLSIEFNGIRIAPTDDVSGQQKFDVIWIPSLMIDERLTYKNRKKMIRWIREQANHGAEIASVCTGAFLLAETGLLNHRQTTLHWSFSDLFSDTYPLPQVKPHVPLTSDGNIHCAAADSEWITLASAILERRFGRVFSAKTAEMFVFNGYKRVNGRVFETRFVNQTKDAIIAKTQAWIAEHICEENLISRAAIEFGLSESALARRFKSAHRESVINFIQHVRIERAKEALEMTKLPVERISDLVGYRDSSYFRRLFKIKTGMTPKQYRKHCSA